VHIDISVVVPVYNPGTYLQPLLRSLEQQTMASERFEVILVDDGSDDGTAERLDAWAAEHSNTLVVHQPNHGWPGQPRNVGIDRAAGRYIYFVDQDDWLGDEALARVVAYGDENNSDVVIGKMKGIGRGVPRRLFAASVPKAVIGRTPLQDSLTPHKVFRTAFLERIGLRFPEGKRRLEDHLFVTTAFLRADVVSVYADYDCYIHITRDDHGNAAGRLYEPADYYRNLEEVLDVVDRYLPAGERKDRYLQRWIRTELVGRLKSRLLRNASRTRRDAFFTEISRILRTRIPDSAFRILPFQLRLDAALARYGNAKQFFRLDHAVRGITLVASPSADGVFTVRLLDGIHRISPTARVSDLLHAHGAANLVPGVVALVGGDPLILPPTADVTRPDGAKARAQRVGESAQYALDPITPGDTVTIAGPLGPRSGTVVDLRRRRVRRSVTIRQLTKAFRRSASHTARQLLGPRRTAQVRALMKRARRRAD